VGAEVKLSGTKELRAALEAAGTLATMSLASAMTTEMMAVVRRATGYVPVNTGTLRSSGTVLPPEIKGSTITVTCGFGGAAAGYAIFVHEGRRAGAKPPPVAVIKQWLHDKGLDEGLAYPIARAIGQRGLPKSGKPSKFLERAFLERRPGMETRLAEGLTAAFQRLNRKA